MRVLLLVGATGCFAPNPPAGAPCDPASATPCPGDQVCIAQAGGHFCLPPGTPPIEADAALTDSPIAPDPDGPSPDAAVTHFEYVADVAECVDPALPDPTKCRTENKGPPNNDLFQMVVDSQDTANNNAWVAYVRFPVDDQLAGKTIASIKLRVTATDDDLAPASTSGEVFAVEPFSLADLSTTAPAKVGARLAPSQGAVVKLGVIEFPLPLGSVTAGAPGHFGIFPISTGGVNYWNVDGPNPPVLVIDTE